MSDDCGCGECGACEIQQRIAELDAAIAAHYRTSAGMRAMGIIEAINGVMGEILLREQPRSIQLGAHLWAQYSTGIHPTQRWHRTDVEHNNMLLAGRPAWLNPELPDDAFAFDGYAEPRGRVP